VAVTFDVLSAVGAIELDGASGSHKRDQLGPLEQLNGLAEELIDKRVGEAKTEKRNEIITRLNDASEFTQADIAGAMGLTQSHVSRIANA